MALEHQIVVPGDDNFVAMGLPAKPVIEIDNFPWPVAIGHEIAGVNQHVSIRHVQFGVLAVRITDAHNANSRHRVAFNIAGAWKRPLSIDLSVPCPTLTLVGPARGSNQ